MIEFKRAALTGAPIERVKKKRSSLASWPPFDGEIRNTDLNIIISISAALLSILRSADATSATMMSPHSFCSTSRTRSLITCAPCDLLLCWDVASLRCLLRYWRGEREREKRGSFLSWRGRTITSSRSRQRWCDDALLLLAGWPIRKWNKVAPALPSSVYLYYAADIRDSNRRRNSYLSPKQPTRRLSLYSQILLFFSLSNSFVGPLRLNQLF